MKNDFELLRAYVDTASEAAFTELVERHKGLVYASALRQTGDPGLAEEITQAVFIVLARKAASLKPETIISGWLFRATGFAAADAFKRERRRLSRESEAMNESGPGQPPNEADLAWKEIAPVLDESLARLGEVDRNAVLLRFFEQKSLAEIGVALGLSEEASRKRVQRALEKLRLLLSQRGIVVPAVVLAGALTANAVPVAPATLTVTTLAATGAATPLVKGILGFMAWSKAKIALVSAAALLLAGSGAVVTLHVVKRFASVRASRAPLAAPPSAPQSSDVVEEMTMSIFEAPAADAEGFISLFNGRDLTGWNYNPHVWFVTNGLLTGRVPQQATRMVHYLAWAGDEVENFELRLKFRGGGGVNSGVPFRCRWAQQRWFPGYQADIDRHLTGLLVIAGPGRERRLSRQGWRTIAGEQDGKYAFQQLESVAEPDQITNALAAVTNGEWCDFSVLAQGRRFVIRLNGITMVDTRDDHPTKFVPRGMLGLEYQHREGMDDFIEFKDIRFKRLPSEAAP